MSQIPEAAVEAADEAACRLDGMFRDIFNKEERHDILRTAFEAAAPLIAPPDAAVPAGWRLVPIEPTPEMEAAHFAAHAMAKAVFATVPEIWAAMLAAAPKPGSGE